MDSDNSMLNKKKSRKNHKSNLFMHKLYDILNNEEYKDIINWDIEGNGIIIKNIMKFCEIVLPKFWKHNNYSSFVRQLNLYGFHKSQGIIKEGEKYEHDNFFKDTTKEEIKQITIQNKRNRFLNDISNNSINGLLPINNENDILKLILFQLEENHKKLRELKHEMVKINNQNKTINKNLDFLKNIFNGQRIIIGKILQKREENNNKKNEINKSTNLKELFKKYLYYLKIYSPFISIDNNSTSLSKEAKAEHTRNNTINYNEIKDISSNNVDKIENIYEDNELLNQKQNTWNLDLNLNNDISSCSFLYCNKDIK